MHRSETAGFTPSGSTLLESLQDIGSTGYQDSTATPEQSYSYRVVAATDGADQLSNERRVTLPEAGTAQTVLQPGPADGQATFIFYYTEFQNCGNYGALPTLYVGASLQAIYRGLLAFDLGGIPDEATVEGATLSLYQSYRTDEPLNVRAHRVTRSWQEGTGQAVCTGDGATWYEADGGVAWTDEGGDFDPAVVDTMVSLAGESPRWYQWELASLVQDWVDGTEANQGLMLKLDDESLAANRYFIFHSDDAQVAPTLRPKLAVTYTEPQREATTNYVYDRLSRLTEVDADGALTSYLYDPVGNRLERTRDGTPVTYLYDRGDRIESAGGVSYTVDANGNLVARGPDSFGYDQANRLVSATVDGLASSYAYDGDGKRASSTVDTVTTSYVYDVNRGLPVVLDDGERKYVWGLGLAYAVDGSDTLEVYHTDGLGSVRAITDASAEVVQTYRTDEFGIPDAAGTQGALGQPFQYTGEQQDAETGFVYLRARHYDPSIGRFVQRDPFPGFTDLPESLARYSYVVNNPVAYRDPTGHAVPAIVGLVLITGSIGGVGGTLGYTVVSGLSGTYDQGEALIAAGVGVTAGAAAPFTSTTFVGAALTGAGANVLQYATTNVYRGTELNPLGISLAAGLGIPGGVVGGRLSREVVDAALYRATLFTISDEFERVRARAMLREAVAIERLFGAVLRSGLGASVTNTPLESWIRDRGGVK